jgi:tetratricopeptide (TPR) repeat protein
MTGPGPSSGGADPSGDGLEPSCAIEAARTNRARPVLLASLGIISLLVAAVLALRQRDLLDPARLEGSPARAARLLVERQRYGPGDPARFEALIETDPARAHAIISRAIELAPTWAAFRYARGLALLGAGEYERADRSFETACRLAPAHSGLAERIGAVWVREARRRSAPKLLLYSFPRFKAAAELDPRTLESTARLLRPFLPDVLELAPLVPENPAARGAFGLLLLEAGHHAEAVRELTIAIGGRRKPDWILELALGRARLGNSDAAGASEAFKAAVTASPTPSDLLRSLYDDFARAGQGQVGLELWEALATNYPGGARFNLGRHWFEAGRKSYRQSFAEFEAVWQVSADPATAGYLARIEIAWRLYRDARIRLQRVLLKAPRDPDLHYLLALAHDGQGNSEEAVRELERARKLYPSNELYPRLLEQWRGR